MRRSAEEIALTFGARVTGPLDWPDAIYPRHMAPVIIAPEGDRRLGLMRWGWPGPPGISNDVTNARNLDSPFWYASLEKISRRCLVPFTAFAEPKRGGDGFGHPDHHWFHLCNQPIAAFAGLWRSTEHGAVFAFCTCPANMLVGAVHPKAMPVILAAGDTETWLQAPWDEARVLVRPFPDEKMAVGDGSSPAL